MQQDCTFEYYQWRRTCCDLRVLSNDHCPSGYELLSHDEQDAEHLERAVLPFWYVHILATGTGIHSLKHKITNKTRNLCSVKSISILLSLFMIRKRRRTECPKHKEFRLKSLVHFVQIHGIQFRNETLQHHKLRDCSASSPSLPHWYEKWVILKIGRD